MPTFSPGTDEPYALPPAPDPPTALRPPSPPSGSGPSTMTTLTFAPEPPPQSTVYSPTAVLTRPPRGKPHPRTTKPASPPRPHRPTEFLAAVQALHTFPASIADALRADQPPHPAPRPKCHSRPQSPTSDPPGVSLPPPPDIEPQPSSPDEA
ncbi:hypothetical protein [Actinoplanes sp. RD1]|uniref:hypothetical protein n=1 Tax=Actinoplanes sp. RD1 TaxID=3064538 RepID=UPI0027425427|nr:hypothetical protein [Actinoplanes sp. RD1]